VQANEPEAAVTRIIELVKTRIPRRFGLDPIRDIQVLCPMNRGAVGARTLNIELQAALNPAGERKVERSGSAGEGPGSLLGPWSLIHDAMLRARRPPGKSTC
jgi:ATP-dependent exoDNAse (exonuclease V) alpha subunit